MISAGELEKGESQLLNPEPSGGYLDDSYRVIRTDDRMLRVEPFDGRGFAKISFKHGDYEVAKKEDWDNPYEDFIEPHLAPLNPVPGDHVSAAQMGLQMVYEEALEDPPLIGVEKMVKAVELAEDLVGEFSEVRATCPSESEPSSAYFWYNNGINNLQVNFSGDEPVEEVTGLMYAAGKAALEGQERKPVIDTGVGHKEKDHHVVNEERVDRRYLEAVEQLTWSG